MSKGKIWFALAVLFAINMMNFYDRLIIGAVGEVIRVQEPEWHLSDTDLGYLGTAFILLYAAVGVPLGRWSDRGNRSRILTIGVTVWSILTALSGMAQTLLADGRAAVDRGRGRSDLCAGLQLADRRFVSGQHPRPRHVDLHARPAVGQRGLLVVQRHRGQAATVGSGRSYVALVPGLLCAVGACMLHEPKRGGTEVHDIGAGSATAHPTSSCCPFPRCVGSSPPARCTTSTCTRSAGFSPRS